MPVDLLIIVPDLAPGGVTRHTEMLVGAARARGRLVRVLVVAARTGSPDDPAWVAEVRQDLSALTDDALLDLLRDSSDVVVQASPATIPLLIGLQGQRVALAVHGSPGTNLPWWGSATRALTSFHSPQDLPGVVVPAAGYAAGVAAELGAHDERVAVAPNATLPYDGPPLESPGLRHLTVPMRLAPDKLWVLESAIELAQVAQVPVHLVGAGPGTAQMHELLADSGLSYEVRVDADVRGAMEQADVVVGVGIAALEAAARGRRVVVPSKQQPGRFAGVLNPDTWSTLRAGNFAGIGGPSISTEQAWTEVSRLTADQVGALAQLVRDEASPEALLDAVLSAARPVGQVDVERARLAFLRGSGDQALQLAQFAGWVHVLQQELESLRQHEAEHAVVRADLDDQIAELRGDNDRLAAELRAQQQMEVQLQQAHDRAQHELRQVRQQAQAAQASADQLWGELQTVLSSTAWRASAPLRSAATAVRQTERLPRLLAQVNRRKLGAAARLVARGEWATVRQRVKAVEAVARASEGSTVPAGRPVQEVASEPWPPDQPLVTVVVPCFNYGDYVDEAIASVLGQTVADRLELVVVDGGSTDPATIARMTELEAAPPPRTSVIVRRDGRHLVGDNRNVGIRAGSGRYVCCLDADDVLEPVYLEVALYLLERWGYDLVSSVTQCFGMSEETFGLLPQPTLEDMLLANNVTTVAVYRRSLWEAAGGYHDAGLGGEYVFEDWKLWIRLAALGARIRNIVGMPLFRYRVHSVASLSRQSGSVAEMARHREAVREHNRDVVTPEAIEASRRAAAVQVIVRDGWQNLVPVERDPRPTVLLAMPFLCVGGAERLLSSVVAHLARAGFRVIVTTDVETDRSLGDTTPWFKPATREVYHLHRLLDPHRWCDFVHYLVAAKGVDIVLVAGSAHTYALLPQLREQHPQLRVADLLFNTVGHVENNRRFADLIDLHLCEQAEVEQWLLDAGQARESVVRIPSGIDVDDYRPAPQAPRQGLRVGYSGRLSEEKDPLLFVDVAAMLASDARLSFVMTGAGPLEKQIRRRLSPDAVLDFLGVVPDVRAHLGQLDVLVVPSRFDGRPMVVLEALALGVPVLASGVGGLPELIQHEENGLLCPAGDAAAFAAQLRRLTDDPDLLATLKQGARRSAEERLNAAAMYAGYEEALRSLLPDAP